MKCKDGVGCVPASLLWPGCQILGLTVAAGLVLSVAKGWVVLGSAAGDIGTGCCPARHTTRELVPYNAP